MKNQDELQRVWLLVGAALAALFLLRTAGMVFQGALTGVGMYVAIMVAFSTFPPLRRLLFAFGGLSDLIISFGLPLLLSSAMGITGGTMMIGALTCGLLFTFTLKTKELGGAVKATVGTTQMVARNALSSYEEWRRSLDDENRTRHHGSRRGCHDNPGNLRESQKASREGPGREILMIEVRPGVFAEPD